MQRMPGARSHFIPATTAGIPADAEAEKSLSALCADANIENTGLPSARQMESRVRC